ncbi:hypothetical protein FA13DRAFT_1792770 [Coprinellus micaceus]|uniref:F-box domain-containing protein n=1 Tax=Coprinellus micaceus TaxID=71717 RepID=A0A4Y7T6T0_COPMI|nr:hypothetical protein FA13DRAFT_1792770 [Coprinellus micaceus]
MLVPTLYGMRFTTEAVHDNSSHIVSCSSNRNTVQHLVTAFAEGDPLSASLYPLIQDVNRGGTPSKLAQLSKVAQHYRDHASSLKREDAQLQEDIMEMMVRLAQVRADIVEAENRLDLACNSMSPIRLLPSELLEVIFLDVVGGIDREEWAPAKSSPQTAISHVCGGWRRISLQLPHLWNRFLFDIGIPLHNSRHPRQNLLYLEQWVERSNPLPFSICLRTNTHFPHPSDGPYYDTILQSIADSASSRIELLRVHSDNPILLESTAWSRFVPAKCLELVGTRNIAGRITLPCHSFNQLPSLTSVHYDVSPASPFLFPVSFSSLTEIEVGESNEGVDAYALRYLLRCCPKLKRGRFFMATSGGRGGFILNGFVSANAVRDVNPNDSYSLEQLECLALNGHSLLTPNRASRIANSEVAEPRAPVERNDRE